MATAKKTSGILVTKHKEFEIGSLGTRTKRELRADIEQAASEGYKVYGISRVRVSGSGETKVKIQMGLHQAWTVDDLMLEVDELLGK